MATQPPPRCQGAGASTSMNASNHDVITDVPESLVVLTHDEELLQTLRRRRCRSRHFHRGCGGRPRCTPARGSCRRRRARHVGCHHADRQALREAEVAISGPRTGGCRSRGGPGAAHRADHARRRLSLPAKPVSEQRVRLFVTAAWRRHGVEHAGDHRGHGDEPAQAGVRRPETHAEEYDVESVSRRRQCSSSVASSCSPAMTTRRRQSRRRRRASASRNCRQRARGNPRACR